MIDDGSHASFFINTKLWEQGGEIYSYMKKEFCPNCNREMKINKFIDKSSAIMKCKHCQKTFKFTYDEQTFPANIKSFNWGAFFLGAYWGFWNGATGYALTCWTLSMISNNKALTIIATPILLALSLYYGIKGNRISWSKKNWSSIENFEKSQERWSIAAWIVFLSLILIILVTYLNNRL